MTNPKKSDIINWNMKFHRAQAEHYDQNHTISPIIAHLFDWWVNDSDRVLDIGTGSGVVRELISSDNVVGIDLSKPMLLNGNQGNTVVQGSVDHLPFLNDVFDVVTGRSILHHLPDLQKVYRECRRVLRPGGRIIIANEPIGMPLIKRIRTRIQGQIGFWLGRHEGWKSELATQLNTDPVTLTRKVNVHSGSGIKPSTINEIFEPDIIMKYRKNGETKLAYFGHVPEKLHEREKQDRFTEGVAIDDLR